MDDNESKFLLGTGIMIGFVAISAFVYMSYSSHQETLRFKECVTAGNEWVRTTDSPYFMECKKVK